MNAAAARQQSGSGDSPPPERRNTGRPRAESSAATGSTVPRPSHDGRRKRLAEGRYAGWGDGVDRLMCARAAHVLPTTFPVASHTGAATIATSIVARRPDALLLCSFSHCGDHAWPDGDIVAEANGQSASLAEHEHS